MELDPKFAQRVGNAAHAIVALLDLDARLLYSDPYLARCSGYRLAERRGRDWFDAFIPAREQPRIRAMFAKVCEGTRVTGMVTPIRARGGEEMLIEWSCSALTDDAGAPWAVIAIGHDPRAQLEQAEQRQRAEARLRRSEQMLRRAQAIAHIGSFDARFPFGADDMIYSDELYRILGRRRDEPAPSLRTLLTRVLHPEDRPAVFARLRTAAQTHAAFGLECRVRRPDGATRCIHLELEPDDPNGRDRRWVGVAHDVTEPRALEQAMLRAQRLEAAGTLAVGIAHDYNNLLMGIIGCIDLAERHSPPAGPAHDYLHQARKAAHKGAALTRRLLTFAEPTTVGPSEVALDTAIDASIPMIRSVLGKHVQLDVSLAVRHWPILIDRAQLDQILMNLVVNARDAMPKGGTCTIRTDEVTLTSAVARAMRLPPGDYVRLRVGDTGTGMDPRTAARLFEPSFTTKPSERGTGLGLATVHRIVRACGGHIGVASPPGVGTEITLHLPRLRGTGELPAVGPRSHRPRRGSETVLVVAHQPLIRAAVRTLLEPLGYRILEASGAPAATRLVQELDEPFDVVLANAWLPDGSGAELADQLRALGRRCPVVLMSTDAREALEKDGAIAPGQPILKKPFSTQELVDALTHALEAARPPAPATER